MVHRHRKRGPVDKVGEATPSAPAPPPRATHHATKAPPPELSPSQRHPPRPLAPPPLPPRATTARSGPPRPAAPAPPLQPRPAAPQGSPAPPRRPPPTPPEAGAPEGQPLRPARNPSPQRATSLRSSSTPAALGGGQRARYRTARHDPPTLDPLPPRPRLGRAVRGQRQPRDHPRLRHPRPQLGHPHATPTLDGVEEARAKVAATSPKVAASTPPAPTKATCTTNRGKP